MGVRLALMVALLALAIGCSGDRVVRRGMAPLGADSGALADTRGLAVTPGSADAGIAVPLLACTRGLTYTEALDLVFRYQGDSPPCQWTFVDGPDIDCVASLMPPCKQVCLPGQWCYNGSCGYPTFPDFDW